MTYHGLRPRDNRLVRGLRRLLGTPGAALDEELVVETSVLVGKAEVAVHFGKPIEVNDHLSGAGEVIRKMRHRDEVMLRRPARRLTDRAMMAVYGGVEISFDHLFCSALRYLPDGMVDRNRLHHALFLAATELRGRDEVRLHPVLRNGISALVCGGDWSPLEDTLDLSLIHI